VNLGLEENGLRLPNTLVRKKIVEEIERFLKLFMKKNVSKLRNKPIAFDFENKVS
jgi:hypothetical protein